MILQAHTYTRMHMLVVMDSSMQSYIFGTEAHQPGHVSQHPQILEPHLQMPSSIP